MILKLKRTPGIYLVGFMGSGKSTVGRALARELGWGFCDLDEDIEAQHKCSISEIFDQHGEAEFRRREHEALARRVNQIRKGDPLVIALGGGAFVQQNNFELIESAGVSIWLDPPFPIIRRRVEGSTHRPLARDPVAFEKLYHERRKHYAKADYHIRDTESAAAVVSILQLPIFHG
jgi:Shikimate kinase